MALAMAVGDPVYVRSVATRGPDLYHAKGKGTFPLRMRTITMKPNAYLKQGTVAMDFPFMAESPLF